MWRTNSAWQGALTHPRLDNPVILSLLVTSDSISTICRRIRAARKDEGIDSVDVDVCKMGAMSRKLNAMDLWYVLLDYSRLKG